jgi:hypothetical protein
MKPYERTYKAVPFVTSLLCPCVRETEADYENEIGTELAYLGMDEMNMVCRYECPSCKSIYHVSKKYPIVSYREDKNEGCGGNCPCKSPK